ncbi:MAG TPA: DUF1684 domain-containing protein [Candidatus Acidoferrum sp.]|nr:DUF1684 domain-containing protein [Candidatus Acidoferrum sp.]
MRRFITTSMTSKRAVVFALVALLSFHVSAANDANYQQSVEKWRHDYQAKLTSDTGWLTVAGLFWMHEGENSFGSDQKNNIVLPAGAPAFAGVFSFHDGKTSVRLNTGVAATMNGKPVETADLYPDSREDRVVVGDLTLFVHASGGRFAIRMKDKNSQLRKNFTGLNWFPIDPAYHVTAKFVSYPALKELDSQNVLGDAIKLKVIGYVSFSLKGQTIRLDAEENDSAPGLFIVFRDLTSGKLTYPASRFLDTEVPKDGAVELDFNEAYNPPCAYNSFTTCPLPLPGNRLQIEIPVGEKLYKHGH